VSVAFREHADIDVILSTEGRHRDQLEGQFTLFTSDYELEPAFLGKNMSKMAKFNVQVLDQVTPSWLFLTLLTLGSSVLKIRLRMPLSPASSVYD
tara:strand:+ start:58 stop:342 length:285 start_codon:yes stop_codon:yes gene_type:complete